MKRTVLIKDGVNNRMETQYTDEYVPNDIQNLTTTTGNCDRSQQSTPSNSRKLFYSFFASELSRGYVLEHDEARYTEKTQKVYTFIKIPKEVERFMMYGFFQCLDAFLFIFTFLPTRVCLYLFKILSGIVSSPRSWESAFKLEPGQTCDLLKGIILLSCFLLLSHFDVSMIYHLIRGQAIIKLYIFFNMLEVADKLFSSFGQDILDSLFWTATEKKTKARQYVVVLLHLLLAVIYVFCHALLVLVQATTLNVAFNSHNKALLTIMMSNNFVEIKGSVFKKFEKNDLFQMSCSDVRERFHYVLLLAIVCIRNMAEFNWNTEHLWILIPDVCLVLFAEILVDWTKHAFITKFNHIRCEVYKEYTTSIAFDMVDSRHKNAIVDHLDIVSRRMGFIPLPLAAILVWVVISSVKDCSCGMPCILLLILFFVCLLTTKLLVSIVLLGIACVVVTEAQQQLQQQEKSPRARSKSVEPMCEEMRQRTASFTRRMQRSRSIGSHINFRFPDYEPTLSGRVDRFTTAFQLQANSTVSLESVGLNEEYLKVKAMVDRTLPAADSDLDLRKRRNSSSQLTENPPLSEVDRYTMCANRIAV